MNLGIVGRFRRFEPIYKSQSLETYFGLIHNFDKLTIVPQKSENKLLLNIHVEKKHYYDFKTLPSDISNLISEYLPEYITICVEITYPPDYPFKPPLYTLLSTNYNISNLPISIHNYYTTIVDNHNLQYDREWSAAIDIEKDILYFICRINHFEYLL
jgi:hypothetical protein